MTISSLQRRIDLVAVGHRDGAGRAVVWRTAGVAKDADAVRQAAVLPSGGRFAVEPGWLLRRLPSGRWLFLVGGTQHPDLLDSFGRTGIFHGVGWVADGDDAMSLLGADDAGRLARRLVTAGLEGLGRPVPGLEPPVRLKPRRLPGGDKEVPLTSTAWIAVRNALAASGVRPFVAPLQGASGPLLVAGQDKAGGTGSPAAFTLDGSEDAARRILAAWSGREP